MDDLSGSMMGGWVMINVTGSCAEVLL
jgi:hypothetical protein